MNGIKDIYFGYIEEYYRKVTECKISPYNRIRYTNA